MGWEGGRALIAGRQGGGQERRRPLRGAAAAKCACAVPPPAPCLLAPVLLTPAPVAGLPGALRTPGRRTSLCPAGCRDYAPLLSLPAALAWWRAVGPERARAYMARLCADAVALLSARWGTGAIAPPCMRAAMACVELPPAAVAAARRQRLASGRAAERAAQAAAEPMGRQGGDGGGEEGAAAAVGGEGGGGAAPCGSVTPAPEPDTAGPPESVDANWIQVRCCSACYSHSLVRLHVAGAVPRRPKGCPQGRRLGCGAADTTRNTLSCTSCLCP